MLDVGFALTLGRESAEAIFRDACTIRTSPTAGAWDDATGTYAESPGAVLYSGPCRVRRPNAQEREVWAGDAEFILLGAVVSIPVGVDNDVPPGSVVTVDGCEFDPALTGRVLVVRAGHTQSQATARRLRCVEVARP